MTKLIALIDGSIYSQSVCDHAAWFADRSEGSVDILHVLGRREASGDQANLSGSIGLGARTALLEELAELDSQKAKFAQKRGRAILEDAEERIRATGVEAVSTMLRNGDLLEAVEEFSENSDLIVIGKRGEAADFAKLHLGSNLERVVRAYQKPVLVASRAFKPIERVLIAFDGGVSSMKAVDHIARNPVFAGLTCHVLMAGPDNSDNRRHMESALALLQGAGIEATSSIEAGQPEKVIASHAEASEFDLLVMGAYGHSRIRSLIIGSTTTEMIRSCLIPVMLFR